MTRSFSFFLARRYLRPKRTSVSVITVICIAGVALAVWILLVVIAVMAGFAERAKELILGYESHVFVEIRPDLVGPPYPMHQWREIAERVRDAPGVRAVEPVVEGFVLADAFDRRAAYRMRAFPADDPWVREQIELEAGELALEASDSAVVSDHVAASLGLILGDTLTLYSQGHIDQVIEAFDEVEREPLASTHAGELRGLLDRLEEAGQGGSPPEGFVSLDDAALRATVSSLDNLLRGERRPSEAGTLRDVLAVFSSGQASDGRVLIDRAQALDAFAALDALTQPPDEDEDRRALDQIKELVLPKEVVVTGIFKQPPAPNAPSLFVPLHIGQELYSLGDTIHSLTIRTDDPYQARGVAEAVATRLPPGYASLPWMERPGLKGYFYALANERRMMYFALACVMVVAGFCIMVTMITTTVEKSKQIGVMKALGARKVQIVAVFVIQGTLVGVLGVVVGLIAAALTLHFRDQIQAALGAVGMDPFPAETYQLDRIPALLTLTDITIIGIGAFVLSSLAALPPAWLVARLEPAKALRKE